MRDAKKLGLVWPGHRAIVFRPRPGKFGLSFGPDSGWAAHVKYVHHGRSDYK